MILHYNGLGLTKMMIKLGKNVLSQWKISWLEEDGLIGFIEKDMKQSQLCRLSTFSSGEKLFNM